MIEKYQPASAALKGSFVATKVPKHNFEPWNDLKMPNQSENSSPA
jgi:hypothetical protein